MFYPCKRSGPSLCVHVKQQEKCGRISGVGNKLKKGPSLQDSDNITLRIVCCRVFIFCCTCCWFVLFSIICQWESQSSESLLPLIESAQQGLPQQEWLLRQGKKYIRLFQAHAKSWYFVKGNGQNVFGQFSFNWFNNHVKVTCDDGTSYKTGVEKSYKHPRFQEQSSTFTLSVMSLNSTSLIIIMLIHRVFLAPQVL